MHGEEAQTSRGAPIAVDDERAVPFRGVTHAFVIIAALLVALMLFIWSSRQRIADAARAGADRVPGSALAALKSRWAVFGAVAIGLYVGAEVSIGSIMINFLNRPEILDVPLETAGFYLASIYWMGALVGRFIGSALLTRVSATRLLTISASAAAALCAIVATTEGSIAAYAALAVGLFNSIMFPTTFTITLERSGVSQSSTSGLLCVAIVGGAVLPFAVGRFADSSSLSLAFLIPMLGYATIALFAALAARARVFRQEIGDAPAAPPAGV
jgi:FHS family L-fucose permease-like MFS transporter